MTDTSIDVAKVDMFNSNVIHISQQKESSLLPFVRRETQKGESDFFDRLGKSEMRRKAGRNSDVEYTDKEHSRRMVVTEPWYDAALVDKEDKMRVIQNPESEYAISMGMGAGRKIDDIIIEAGLGSAWTGRKGTTEVTLPTSQKLVCFDGTILTGVGLNIDTLRALRKMFKQNEAISKGEKIILAVAAQQTDDLLGQTEATSADYNTVKTLAQGDIDTFMGFLFVETELLPFNEGAITYNKDTGEYGAGTGTIAIGKGRRCLAFTNKRGLLLSFMNSPSSKMDVMPGKHYAVQVYHSMDLGGTRMEEEQVVELICYEA
jgi:hypothetical protein